MVWSVEDSVVVGAEARRDYSTEGGVVPVKCTVIVSDDVDVAAASRLVWLAELDRASDEVVCGCDSCKSALVLSDGMLVLSGPC